MNATRKERPYPMSEKYLARFTAKYEVVESGCWEWQGSLAHGYRYFSHGKSVRAHRASYQHFVGRIPDGFVIDHLCRNTRCVNPSHLEAVTQAVNVQRSIRGTILGGTLTHCPKGHEYTPDNIRDNYRGYSECWQCYTAFRKLYQKRKARCEVCPRVMLRNNLARHMREVHKL